MTERVQPGAKGSRYRGIEIGEAVSALGNYIVDPANPTLSSIRYGTIDQAAFTGFTATTASDSLDVTIGPGEAFVDGWLAKDTSTTVTLDADTAGQTVVLGWNPDAVYDEAVDATRDDADEVLLDTQANVEAMTQEKPYIPIHEFDTDSNGVISSTRVQPIGSEQPSTTRLDDGTIQYESDDGSVAFEVLPGGGVNITSLQLSENQLDSDGDGVFDNADIEGLANLASGDAFSDYPLLSADLATAAVGADEIADGAVGNAEIDNDGSFTFNNEVTLSGGATDLPSPTADSDAARKAYVDAIEQGLDIKDSVAVSNHDGNIDLSSSTDPNPVDGYTLSDGERILLKHQDDATENGIYDVVTATDPTTWVRSSDFDTTEEANQGAFTYVENGSHSDESYVQLTKDPVLGTDPLEFSLFSRAGELTAGNQLSKDGSTFNVSTDPQFNSVNDSSGNTMLGGVVATGTVMLSDGVATVDTTIDSTDSDATFMLALGLDDSNVEVAGGLHRDGSGNYQVRIRETDTDTGNPTVDYDVVRVR
jgi:hypothetical protein